MNQILCNSIVYSFQDYGMSAAIRLSGEFPDCNLLLCPSSLNPTLVNRKGLFATPDILGSEHWKKPDSERQDSLPLQT